MTQQDPDVDVRKSASDIWTTCCSQCETVEAADGEVSFSSVLIPLLKQYAPTLICTLLDGMIYSEIDLQQIHAELQDAAKLHGASVYFLSDFCHSFSGTVVAPGLLAGSDIDGEDGGDGDGDETDPEEEWTLRKACAKSLDELAKLIGSSEFFSILAPQLHTRMQSVDWKQQECALLAIGAVAPGCDKAIVSSGSMSGIFAHVVQVLQQPQQHFLIISIGCWTISRLSNMFAHEKTPVHSVLSVLCNFLGSDNTKVHHKAFRSFHTSSIQKKSFHSISSLSTKVREGAVSSVATIIESCRNLGGTDHIQEISNILSQFLALCIQTYQGRNLLIALDASEQLAMCCNLATSASVRFFHNQSHRVVTLARQRSFCRL